METDKLMEGWFTENPPEEPIRRRQWKKEGTHKRMTRCDRYAMRGFLFCRRHQPIKKKVVQ